VTQLNGKLHGVQDEFKRKQVTVITVDQPRLSKHPTWTHTRYAAVTTRASKGHGSRRRLALYSPTTIFFMVNAGRAMDLRSKATLLAPHRSRYAVVTPPA
jgi:hypothetical protein